MALTHIICCNQRFTIEEALQHLEGRDNKCEWTWELASAMLEGEVAHPSNDDPTQISTTTLTTKCLRQQAFTRYTDYDSTFADLYARFRGTLFHGQMERWARPGSYGEARFFIRDLGLKLPAVKKALPRIDRSFSGSPDLVDPVAGVLFDYKRTKAVPRFDTVWGDHVEQLNVNRWLVDNADSVDLKTGDLPAVGFDLSEPGARARFVPVDWQELVIVYVDDNGPKPITVTESIDVPKVGGKGTKRARVPSIWPDEQVEAYITERYIKAREALLNKRAPIPVGWEHQSHVLCGYCPVRKLCAEGEANGI